MKYFLNGIIYDMLAINSVKIYSNKIGLIDCLDNIKEDTRYMDHYQYKIRNNNRCIKKRLNNVENDELNDGK